ncbi:MAG: hypothetical protein V5A68_07790 [Candidatus Thermoplasmatota archaeon]
MKRELAWRIFAGEFNDSNFELKGEEKMSPSYVISPLGAKINRVFIIGVLTDVENISEQGEFIRAHISDPTGVFTLYSGQYQQEATDYLSSIDVPAFVAVVGKSRTYIPEEGTFYVSIRPETVELVDSDVRDEWILETCKSTKDRVEAFLEAKKMSKPEINDIMSLGYSRSLSEGILESLKKYSDVDITKYISLCKESIEYLSPGIEQDISEDETSKSSKQKSSEKTEKTDDEKKDFEEIEKKVMGIIKDLEGEDGASWDSISEKCEKSGVDKDSIEEALTSLMDKGLIYEPVLGTIKTT